MLERLSFLITRFQKAVSPCVSPPEAPAIAPRPPSAPKTPLASRLPGAGQQVAPDLHRPDPDEWPELRRRKPPPKGAAFPGRCCYSGSSSKRCKRSPASRDRAGAREPHPGRTASSGKPASPCTGPAVRVWSSRRSERTTRGWGRPGAGVRAPTLSSPEDRMGWGRERGGGSDPSSCFPPLLVARGAGRAGDRWPDIRWQVRRAACAGTPRPAQVWRAEPASPSVRTIINNNDGPGQSTCSPAARTPGGARVASEAAPPGSPAPPRPPPGGSGVGRDRRRGRGSRARAKLGREPEAAPPHLAPRSP